VAKLALPLMPSKLGYYINNNKDFTQVFISQRCSTRVFTELKRIISN